MGEKMSEHYLHILSRGVAGELVLHDNTHKLSADCLLKINFNTTNAEMWNSPLDENLTAILMILTVAVALHHNYFIKEFEPQNIF